ncbi:uncharacterized protein MELLADRAFT_71499 [Melampsora larici-populina 98AG31]|uniref:Uncharacterized protein n=1 Tax=Melampsora larici-populina (strain 98AG31 / pathotype 3-4-7) TaxID=747676 RepID=F4RGV1_MELLP|nr:uncharacterized protein MELLADRAFT_71499 [Melampsora larici-populina 98AG31]EGG08203.1 hypothetical protein MELLADRAFT_71499 [Melampsora larici-populina 98AG31]
MANHPSTTITPIHSNLSIDSFHQIKSSSSTPSPSPLPSCSTTTTTTFIKLTNSSNSKLPLVYKAQDDINRFQTDQDFINHILHADDQNRLEPFLDLDDHSIRSRSSCALLIREKLMSIWRLVDPRKPNRHRRFLERTKSKLKTSTFQQVHQLLLFNSMIETLNNYNETLKRFQNNSSKLHRCLIKWDKLKSKDQSFTSTSLEISLNLQRFMEHIHTYYPTSYLTLHPDPDQEEETEEEVETEEVETEEETQEEEEEVIADPEDPPTAPHSSTTTKKISLRAHLLIRFKLHQLRTNARKFNKQFRLHENEKMELKLMGNECIFKMVKDGKVLLEINDLLVKFILDLVILRKKSG